MDEKKRFCRDCVFFEKEERYGVVFEYCIPAVEDTYLSPNVAVRRMPSMLNGNNDCKYYLKKAQEK